MNIEEALDYAEPASDMKRAGLRFVAESFTLAHAQARGGLSLEIGTREGGSALLQLLLINDLYKREERPFLFTVDPYGGKPYQGGDPENAGNGLALYGDNTYVRMKRTLAGFPNHVHWYMESLRFLMIAPWLAYWSRSNLCYVKDFSFALLDGEHKAETVYLELEDLIPLMSRKGIILIDNFDKDKELLQRLAKYAHAIEPGPTNQVGDLQLRIMMEKL